MIKQNDNQIEVPESKLARWAYRFAWIPGVGIVLYPLLAALAMLRISLKGLQGLYYLGKGLRNLIIINLVIYISVYLCVVYTAVILSVYNEGTPNPR